MPKKVLPRYEPRREFKRTVDDFLFLVEWLLHFEFRKRTGVEMKKDFRRLGLRAPRPIRGRETGFVITINGLTVVVWSTFDEKLDKWRPKGKDQMWSLILDGDKKSTQDRPYYIIDKDVENNTLVVAPKIGDEDRTIRTNGRIDRQEKIEIENMNWISDLPQTEKTYRARIRHLGKLHNCQVVSLNKDKATINFCHSSDVNC